MDKAANITIIGGSIAGLLHAMALKKAGKNVQVLEQKGDIKLCSDKGLSLGPYFQQFLQMYRNSGPTRIKEAIQNTGCVIFCPDGSIESTEDLPPLCADVVTSTWNTVYRILLQDLQAEISGYGSVVLRTGTRVSSVQENGDRISVTFSIEHNGKEETCEADLVIAADGAQSIVRNCVSRGVKPVDAGCVAWRGDLPLRHCPAQLRCVLEGRLGFVRMPESGSYIILQAASCHPWSGSLTLDRYAKPSNEKTEQSSGGPPIEWCWYDKCANPLKYFENRSSYSTRHTAPSCITSPDVWKERIRSPGTDIPKWIKPLIEGCEAPLLCQVTYLESERCVFLDGKVILVGEAACQPPPYSGLSCDIAAKSAIEMSKLVNLDSSSEAWKEWEKNMLSHAKLTVQMSKKVGERFMGTLPFKISVD